FPDDDSNNELLGPPRVVSRNNEPALDEDDLPSISARDAGNRRVSEPQQGDLHFPSDEPVPTLLNPVADEDDESLSEESGELPPVEEVLVINVISRDPSGFRRPAWPQTLLASGLRLGGRDALHPHASMPGHGRA